MFGIMATSAPVTSTNSTSAPAATPLPGSIRPSIAYLLLAMLAGSVIASMGFGGALYYLARSGRLSMRKGAVSKSVSPVDAHTHLLALGPLLVNLADQGESTYLRLSITLQVEDPTATKGSKDASNKSSDDEIAAVRDTALAVLGQQTADSLLAPSGKEDLKVELLKALNEHDHEMKVKKILFTDFLVQR
jgi:flagellar FliL protein